MVFFFFLSIKLKLEILHKGVFASFDLEGERKEQRELWVFCSQLLLFRREMLLTVLLTPQNVLLLSFHGSQGVLIKPFRLGLVLLWLFESC